jgi:hypothetical protein
MGFFTHWWSIADWSSFTFTVDYLFAAHVWVGMSVDWNQMSWATIWIQWSTAFSFFFMNGFVFAAVVSLTFVRSFKNVTDVDPSTILK